MPKVTPDHICRVCKDEIVIQIFKGTGHCSELCRKLDDGEISGAKFVEMREARDREFSASQES